MPDFLRLPGGIAKQRQRGGGLSGIQSTPGPLPTLQPAQPIGSPIPEVDLGMRREDVLVPRRLPLPEAPEKVGKGKKVLRGLRSILPVIAKLAQGAGTQQPGFLGALGEEYARAQNEPLLRALAEQKYKLGEAGMANIYAQADERGASAARTEGLTQEDALNAAAARDVQNWEARLDEVEAGIKDVERQYAPQMTAAALETEAAAKALKIVQAEMVEADLKRDKWARKNLDPAQLAAFQALTKQRRSAAGLSDERTKQLPRQVGAEITRAELAGQDEVFKQLTAQRQYLALSMQLAEQDEKVLQKEIQSKVDAVSKKTVGTPEMIQEAVDPIYKEYAEQIQAAQQRKKALRDEIQQLGEQTERLLQRGRGATAVLPGMQDSSGVEEARDSLGIL